jgi:Domain of unknown function (DUF1998)
MAKHHGPVLVDTNVIIECWRVSGWKALTGGYAVETVQMCELETQTGLQRRRNEEKIDIGVLRATLKAVHQVSDSEKAIVGNGADRPDRFGILIYTASSGAQGTLGGLTTAAARIPVLVTSALDRLSLCSNDPVCADHDPSIVGDERSLLGAACHACLLVPETSCEARNSFLDRALLAPTVAGTLAGLTAD